MEEAGAQGNFATLGDHAGDQLLGRKLLENGLPTTDLGGDIA